MGRAGDRVFEGGGHFEAIFGAFCFGGSRRRDRCGGWFSFVGSPRAADQGFDEQHELELVRVCRDLADAVYGCEGKLDTANG